MFAARTLRVFIVMVTLYVLLALPALKWPAYGDSPIGLIFVAPYTSIYFFHTVDIPGLLQSNGACGWGWCAPTSFGWAFLVCFWLMITWLLAFAIGRLHPRAERKD